MAGGASPRSSSLDSPRRPDARRRRASSSHALLPEPSFFVRIMHSQGKFATSNRRNRPQLPEKLRSSKIKRLAALRKPRQAEEQEGLASLLLYKRNLPFELAAPAPCAGAPAPCNAKRVKEEPAAARSLFFRSARRFAHFPLFEREADAVFAGGDCRRLHALRRDDDCDSSEADVQSGVARLQQGVLEALRRRQHASPQAASPASCRSRDSADCARRPRNPFKHCGF